MNKFNKKGFTLIEMLVVIAIIAVLVSIIIPVVGNSTVKAKAAADAANLRSAKAELTIEAMNGKLKATAEPGTYADVISESGDGSLYYTIDENLEVTVYFGTENNNIAHYAKIAKNGNAE